MRVTADDKLCNPPPLWVMLGKRGYHVCAVDSRFQVCH